MRYKKKPLTINAIQYKNNRIEIENFLKYSEYDFHKESNSFSIYTREGIMKLTEGNYIVRGIHDEVYPCNKDIFESSYEKSDDTADFLEKQKEYKKYIDEHKENVKKAFLEVKHILYDELNDAQKYSLWKWLDILKRHGDKIEKLIEDHDNSKYDKEEFEPYRNYFYTLPSEIKDEKAFERAWERHYNLNPHHHEFWIKNVRSLDETYSYFIEMICDWRAMSMKFNTSTWDWWIKNKKEITNNIVNRVYIRDIENLLHILSTIKGDKF